MNRHHGRVTWTTGIGGDRPSLHRHAQRAAEAGYIIGPIRACRSVAEQVPSVRLQYQYGFAFLTTNGT